MLQVVLVIGIAGACRREELTKMTTEHIREEGEVFLITIPDSKTHATRQFVLCGRDREYLKQYMSLRPQQVTNKRLFLNFKKGKCTSQVVGINTIGKIPRQIAAYLKLENPETYTGHCFRRSSATLLADAGGDLLTLKRHGGWKSSSVAETYVEESVQNKIKIAEKIGGVGAQNSLKMTTTEDASIITSNAVPYITVKNMTNSSITIKIKK